MHFEKTQLPDAGLLRGRRRGLLVHTNFIFRNIHAVCNIFWLERNTITTRTPRDPLGLGCVSNR
jgi:hypothetical protein